METDDNLTKVKNNRDKLESRLFLFLLFAVSLLFIYLLKPFFGAVFWACVVALLFYPMHIRLRVRLGNRQNLAALITLLACMLIGVVPALVVLGSFFQEGATLYLKLQSGEIDLSKTLTHIRDAFPIVLETLNRFDIDPDSLTERLSGTAVSASQFMAQHVLQLGQGTLQFFVNLGIMLYLTFFMFRDGPRLIALLIQALPLGDERERMLFAKFAEVTRATVKGNLVIAIAQGTLGGLIFWFLGIPSALLWGVVMTLLSLIPVVGASLIWGPVAIYLFAVGDWTKGLILVLFGAIVIGLVDNVFRPILVGRDTKLPDYIVLLSTLGGFALFGINGFVMGPLIASLFMAFWEIFIREFNITENRPATLPPKKGPSRNRK